MLYCIHINIIHITLLCQFAYSWSPRHRTTPSTLQTLLQNYTYNIINSIHCLQLGLIMWAERKQMMQNSCRWLKNWNKSFPHKHFVIYSTVILFKEKILHLVLHKFLAALTVSVHCSSSFSSQAPTWWLCPIEN